MAFIRKRFLGLVLISLFIGSLIVGLNIEGIHWDNEKNWSLLEEDSKLTNNGPSLPSPVLPQTEFTIQGQNKTDALLSFQGAAVLESNIDDDLEITTNNWNLSDIQVNFTDIHVFEPVIIVEEQTLLVEFATIFNLTGGVTFGNFAMEFEGPDDCFIFKLSIYLRYAGNFSVNAKIYRATTGPVPTLLNAGYVAISETKNLTTLGIGSKTEWVEFEFSPRNIKAFLDRDFTASNSFFVVISANPPQDVGTQAFLQWGYLKDSINGDDGKAYVFIGNSWQLIKSATETVDFLLTNLTISTTTWEQTIDVEASSASNFVLVYEEDRNLGDISKIQDNALQFKLSAMSYMTELEVYLKYQGRLEVYADIYNATQSSSSNPGEPIPDELILSSNPTIISTLVAVQDWIKFIFPNNKSDESTFLNLENTFDNTFFVVLRAIGLRLLTRESLEWGYREDSSNGDQGLAYFRDTVNPPEYWTLFEYHIDILENIDLLLKNIILVSYEMNPSDVALSVNGLPVIDYITYDFGGSILLSGIFDGSSGSFLLDISADQKVYFVAIWSALFINQTPAITYFQGKSLSSTISWNVTLSTNFPEWNSGNEIFGLYSAREINITFPNEFNVTLVKYMGFSLPKLSFWVMNQGGANQILTIRNFSIFFSYHGTAGSWRIGASSPNFISELHTYNGTEEVRQFYVMDDMNVTAKLRSETSVKANLTIYNRNMQIVNTSLKTPEGVWAKFPVWAITGNDTHHVVVYWVNGTEVGIKSISLMCVYHTNLSVVYTNIGPQPFRPTDIIYIDVFYNDTDNNAGIPKATIDVNVSCIVKEYVVAGYYNLTIQPFLLPNGNYTARIRASKQGYNLSEILVRFSIFSTSNASLFVVDGVRFTNGNWWAEPDPYFNDQTPIITLLYVNGTPPYKGIEYAQIVADPNWTTTDWFGSPTNLTPGYYDVNIDTNGLHEGDVGKIKITAYSGNFETRVTWVYVNVTEIPSELLYIDAGQYSNITAYEGEIIEIAVGFWDDFHGNPILFANATEGILTWSILGTGANGTLEKSVWQYEDTISLPDLGILGTQTYQIKIMATAARDYATKETNLTLNVLSKENTTLSLTNWTATEYRVGNIFTVFANLAFENGTALVNEWIDFEFTLLNTTGGLIDFYLDSRRTNSTGFVKYEFPTINPGVAQVQINATYKGTEKIDPVDNYLIIPIKPKYNVSLVILSQLPSEILVGNALKVESRLINDETQQGIGNATIEFILLYGSGLTLRRTATSDANGYALVEIEIIDEMADYEFFEVRVEYQGSATTNKASYQASTRVTVLTVGKLILRYLPWVLGAAVAVIATYIARRQLIVVPRRRRRLARMQKMAAKFSDIINLQHILVVHSSTGSCIYQHSFGDVTFDADLISGFLTAISAFQTELKAPAKIEVPFGEEIPESKVQKGFELRYADFKILLQDSRKIRTALILAASPTPSIRASLDEFIKKFETQFAKDLREWRGAMAPFQKATNLVEASFETSLLWPHRIATLDKDVVKELNSLESSLFTLALEIQTEKRYFFLPALVARAEKIRRESQVEILGTIDDLRKKAVFIAIPIDKLQERLEQEANNKI